jgi:hypothetical protein
MATSNASSTARISINARGVLLVLLRIAGAALLLGMAWIHWHLWLDDGYRTLTPIGQLFLANAIGGVVLAIAVGLTPNRFLVLVSSLCALFTAGPLAALLLSLTSASLFGFHESIQAPLAVTTIWVEAAGVVVLAGLSVLAALSGVGARRA